VLRLANRNCCSSAHSFYSSCPIRVCWFVFVLAVLFQNCECSGGTFWFSSASIVDIDGSPGNEMVVCGGSCRVYSYSASSFSLIQSIPSPGGRIYAAHCVVDLDRNGRIDLCFAAGAIVTCLEWNPSTRLFVNRFTATARSELRGMACADIDLDGLVEIAVSSTDSSVQTYVFNPDGSTQNGWPRYNSGSGPEDDGNGSTGGGKNGVGHYRYGSYGLNIGLGNIDDDIQLEVTSSFDNHQIQVWKSNGFALNLCSDFSQIQRGANRGRNITLGQVCIKKQILSLTMF
jgi:hypothetical protein